MSPAFKREALLAREQSVNREPNYEFTGPTIFAFLARFTEVATHGFDEKNKKRVKYLALYAMERAILHYKLYSYHAIALAAAGLHCALACTGHRWTAKMEKITGFKGDLLKPLSNQILRIVLDFNNKLHKAVINKYKCEARGCVSLLRIKQQPGRGHAG